MEQHADTLYRAYTTRDARFDGRVFAGVRTTGIYCRPICPARLPKRENMTFFPTAAAAQAAGYRPCLRCRPEAAPDFAGWHGSTGIVRRALALIEDGWLEDHDIDGLAGEAGVSGRQLRRLFREQLGATPVAVAQTRRVLLAKQLIHETGLSMAEVAMAAGFGSVRRFNETFHDLFHRSPVELRRQHPNGSARPTGISIRLPYRPPYDWDAVVAELGRRAIPGVEHVADGCYARTVRLEEHVGWVEVRLVTGARLELTVHFPRLEALPRIIRRVRRRFDLSADPSAIGDQLAEDPLLAPLVAARPGLRVPGVWDGFEEGVRTILSSDRDQLGALVAAHGLPIDDPAAREAGLTHAFPTPAELAGLSSDPGTPVPSGEATAIRSLAAAVVATPTLLDQHRDPGRVQPLLARLDGFDKDLATTVVWRTLEGYDALPSDEDVPGGRPGSPFTSGSDLRQHAQRWSPWRAYGIAHLQAEYQRVSRPLSIDPASQETNYAN